MDDAVWPELPYAAWRETAATLQLWTQIVGKIRLSLTPWLNHGWQVTLYVTARGLFELQLNGARIGDDFFANGFTSYHKRLDTVTYRMGFGSSRTEARQIVRHNGILVNGRRVNTPSFICRPGDVIEVAEKRPISRQANAGFYWLRQAGDFFDALQTMVLKDAHVNGLFYVAPALNELILRQKVIQTFALSKDSYMPIKSPRQLSNYEHLTESGPSS